MEFHFRSHETNELATALAKAQGEMPIADLNKSNPFFKSKYADFTSVVQASRPALSKYGLSVTQNKIDTEESSFLYTVLQHCSGQWTLSKAKINPPKNDIQSISSYMTYLKRMCYASIVGIVTGDEDDDGEAAVAPIRSEPYKQDSYKTSAKPSLDAITPEQLEQLEHILDGYPRICEDLKKAYKIDRLADLPKSVFLQCVSRINEKKRAEPA